MSFFADLYEIRLVERDQLQALCVMVCLRQASGGVWDSGALSEARFSIVLKEMGQGRKKDSEKRGEMETYGVSYSVRHTC